MKKSNGFIYMHTIKRIGFLTISLLMITACGTTQKSIVAEYDSNINYQYPPVSIYYDAPPENSRLACQIYGLMSPQNTCIINGIDTKLYTEQFKDSSLFSNVFFANNETEYSIAISTAGRTNSKTPHEQEITAEVNIYWLNYNIKKFNYKLPHISKNNSPINNHTANKTFAKSLVSHIIADIQKSQIFSGDFLAKRLNSSDYENNLSVPNTISEFQYSGKFLYNNPLLGSVISYAHPKFHSDKIDLYVYPIRQVNINNSNILLTQELTKVQTEFTNAGKEYEWTDINFSPKKQLDIESNKQVIQGVYSEGHYLEKFGEKNFTSIYLFQLKDKFVKFRASFPASFLTDHIKSIINQIDVPNESPFMKKLREETYQSSLAKNKGNSESQKPQ